MLSSKVLIIFFNDPILDFNSAFSFIFCKWIELFSVINFSCAVIVNFKDSTVVNKAWMVLLLLVVLPLEWLN